MHCLKIKIKKTYFEKTKQKPVQIKIKKVHDSIFRVRDKAHLSDQISWLSIACCGFNTKSQLSAKRSALALQ